MVLDAMFKLGQWPSAPTRRPRWPRSTSKSHPLVFHPTGTSGYSKFPTTTAAMPRTMTMTMMTISFLRHHLQSQSTPTLKASQYFDPSTMSQSTRSSRSFPHTWQVAISLTDSAASRSRVSEVMLLGPSKSERDHICGCAIHFPPIFPAPES